MFEKTVVIYEGDLSESVQSEPIAGIIEPYIDDYVVGFAPTMMGYFWAEAHYSFKFYDTSESFLGKFQITGSGFEKGNMEWGSKNKLQFNTVANETAISQAVKVFSETIFVQPYVRSWLESQVDFDEAWISDRSRQKYIYPGFKISRDRMFNYSFENDDLRIDAEIAVDPKTSIDCFSFNVLDVGLIPVLIFIQNKGDNSLTLRTEEISLTLEDGTNLFQVGPLFSANLATQIADTAGAAAVSPLAGAMTLIAGSSATKAQIARVDHFNNIRLKNTCLSSSQSTHGYVFFVPKVSYPEPEKGYSTRTANVVLKISVINLEQKTITVKIPIDGVSLRIFNKYLW